MSRRVRRRGQSKDKDKVIIASPAFPETPEEYGIYRPCGGADVVVGNSVDWTSLPHDTVVQLFSCLNYRDRACLASTCRTWRLLGSSPCLWNTLDLRAYRCDVETASALASRCSNLRRLRFRGSESASAIINLHARSLREIAGDYCRDITDATLSVIAARHEALESLQICPDPCEKISSDAIRHVAMCCPRLRRLRLSSVREIDGLALGTLARHCTQLEEIAFIDCGNIDEIALGKVESLKFLSVAGSRNLKWAYATSSWSKLPNLVGLDVSRTDVTPSALLRLLSLSKNLKVLCALNCVVLEEDGNNSVGLSHANGKLLVSVFTDIFKKIASLCAKVDIIPVTASRIAEANPVGIGDFWLRQGLHCFLSLVNSSQEDVQERAAAGLATFVVIDDENARVDPPRAEAVMKNGGIPMLLELARCCREGVQSEAAKAIANLSVNPRVAKAVADEGGISILADLARSTNRLVAEEAAGGLWNLSVGEEHKTAIAETGGVKALVDLIFKWPTGIDGVLERAAGALANLAADDKCSLEVAMAGGVHALVMLARSCKAARALANLAAHGDSNSNNAAVGQEAGALEALVQLTCSPNEGVRQEAAGALWNLSFDDRNREAIAAAGGVEALVALANACSNASHGLQERAAGALWGLSVSEANSVAIGREGGVAPLIALARSDAEDVHETAAAELNLDAIIGAEIGRFVAMLRNASSILRACAAFALVQFTIPGGRHAMHHASLLLKAGRRELSRWGCGISFGPYRSQGLCKNRTQEPGTSSTRSCFGIENQYYVLS
ncbi:hypothetical protein HPP92_014479 [Vanilla planifolia]|uniref:F-box domain-containing protein n=1 Tax=Vanilla planifolia TaxID=51239 RepID=A0A835QND9_VANPL|nr:hypothetical protein HPP92_014479 [Vanilla planifolia]